MEAASFISKHGNIYSIRDIVDYSFIDFDVATVENEIEGVDIEDYKMAMRKSVEQGLAYSVYRDEERVGFVYNRMIDGMYCGVSINIWDREGMLMGLKRMFEITDAHKITFFPVNGNLKSFLSMVRGSGIRSFHSGSPGVSINKVDMEERGRALFAYLGMKEVK